MEVEYVHRDTFCRVLRFDNVDTYALSGQTLPSPTVISTDFPSDSSHGWKYISFGPDGKLYVPVGAPCNICEMQVLQTISTSVKTPHDLLRSLSLFKEFKFLSLLLSLPTVVPTLYNVLSMQAKDRVSESRVL